MDASIKLRSLEGCSPWGSWGSDTTEQLHFDLSLSCIGEGNGNPLQCSCLENPREGGAWWAAIYGVAQSWTQLKWLQFSSVVQSCPTLCDPMNCSTPDLPVHHHLPKFTQITSIESVMPSSMLHAKLPLLYLTLWDPMDCSPPDSSVHGILQARVLAWVATLIFRGYAWPGDWTWISCTASGFFTHWATWKALM